MTDREVFTAALHQPDDAARAAFLDEVCGPDAALRQRVESLLAEHQQLGTFMESSTVAATLEVHLSERPGMWIGPYHLLQQIGEGGFGVVFLAQQTEPVQRLVALKVIKPGMDTRQVIARFEAEKHALALMDHINIARVLDAGATQAGRPYFVMELVNGVPITTYCDENHLTPRQRLELFVPVCQAIQHAHQKGIIHRDIKPSNVIVTLYDGQPVPKVIDFGVAKATDRQLSEHTLLTQYGVMVGTLEYMSPEQVEQSASGVDTRSDIYTLGVLLYELLTGSTPVSKKRLKEASYSEILRMIQEEEPARPSARLSDSGQALELISAQRQTDPSRLTKLLRGELDWIVMKTLEKDRNRRYQTACSLGRDVEHYLHNEPVLACPPSSWYRLRKLAIRNRGIFLAASMVALLLLLTVFTLAVSNTRIRREQVRTRQEKERAEKSQALAQDRADEIRQGLKRLKDANALLDRGRWYRSERRWDDAQATITKAIELRPDHASAWVERGNLYAHLGLWELAAADFDRVIKLREPDTTLPWYQHALLRLDAGDVEGYRQACRRMQEAFRGTVRISFVEEMVRSCLLAPTADSDFPALVELSQAVVVDQPWSSYSLYLLGTAHYRAGQHELAILSLREALEKTEWTNRLLSYPILAMAYHRHGRAAEARQALDEAARVLDQWTQGRYPSPENNWVMHQGADAVWPVSWWDWLECQLYYREAKLLIDSVAPPDDPRLHVLRARSLAGLRWNSKAEVEYDEALKLWPNDQQIRMEAHRNRGYRLVGAGQWSEAAAEFARAGEIRPEDSYLWRFRAVAHLAAGEVPAYRKACVSMFTRFQKSDDRVTCGNVLLVCVLRDDSLPDMAQLLPLTRVSDSMRYWGVWVRGAALYRAGKYTESVQCFDQAAKTFYPSAWDWCFLAMAHHRLGHTDESRRCLAEAGRWIRQANGRINASNPLDEYDVAGTRAAWGDWHEPIVIPLLLQEAEALLSSGADVGRQRSEDRRQRSEVRQT